MLDVACYFIHSISTFMCIAKICARKDRCSQRVNYENFYVVQIPNQQNDLKTHVFVINITANIPA